MLLFIAIYIYIKVCDLIDKIEVLQQQKYIRTYNILGEQKPMETLDELKYKEKKKKKLKKGL